MMSQAENDGSDPLQELWAVEERPFVSNTPLFGPLIARFRTAWNSVAARWYVRHILVQQNEFNRLVAARFQSIQQRMAHLDGQVIAQDHEKSALIHDLGEMATQLQQTNRRLEALEARLARLEGERGA